MNKPTAYCIDGNHRACDAPNHCDCPCHDIKSQNISDFERSKIAQADHYRASAAELESIILAILDKFPNGLEVSRINFENYRNYASQRPRIRMTQTHHGDQVILWKEEVK